MTDQEIERILQTAKLAAMVANMMKVKMERAMPELTARGLSLLESIALHPDMTIKDHASELGLVAIPNIIPSLQTLEDLSFIQRWSSPKRRIGSGLYRQVNYQITTAGAATLAEARRRAGAAAMSLIGNFETKELYRVLGEALKDAAGR